MNGEELAAGGWVHVAEDVWKRGEMYRTEDHDWSYIESRFRLPGCELREECLVGKCWLDDVKQTAAHIFDVLKRYDQATAKAPKTEPTRSSEEERLGAAGWVHVAEDVWFWDRFGFYAITKLGNLQTYWDKTRFYECGTLMSGPMLPSDDEHAEEVRHIHAVLQRHEASKAAPAKPAPVDPVRRMGPEEFVRRLVEGGYSKLTISEQEDLPGWVDAMLPDPKNPPYLTGLAMMRETTDGIRLPFVWCDGFKGPSVAKLTYDEALALIDKWLAEDRKPKGKPRPPKVTFSVWGDGE
jgi:hypothetical protein